MSTELDFDHQNDNSGNRRRPRAIVWDFFEKIIGDDGLQKTRCTKCQKVYCTAPNSGTSTMRRHLRKCGPQPLTQLSPELVGSWVGPARSSDELANEGRGAKKLKVGMEENLQNKTERELLEFIWRNKRNIGLLEEKLPDKAVTIKEAIKRYEAELDRRAKLHLPKENDPDPGTSIVAVKIEPDVNQPQSNPQFDNGKVIIKVGNQSVSENESFDGKIREEERAQRLQIVAIHGDQNQQQTAISIPPHDICAELKKVSSMISILTSPNSHVSPQGNPLNEQAEQAKESLIELLNKNFDTIIGSSDEQTLKSCIQILVKNLEKLPRSQGKVIESLNAEFETVCENWKTWHTSVEANIVFEAQHGENLEVLRGWQEKDMEIESEMTKVDADIVRLKEELYIKELTRENLVKRKSDLFDRSKMSVEEAKKLLTDMVTTKLRSDVAIDNLKDLATKWERFREKFLVKLDN